MSEELYVRHTTFLPRKGGSVAYRWQSSDLSLAATYCAQLFVEYRALGSILQFLRVVNNHMFMYNTIFITIFRDGLVIVLL